MIEQTTRYGIATTVELDVAQAVTRTKEELSREGFGVLSEIDISATLKKKLDVDFRPYIILGACNPPLAHQALMAERDIGLLLPCNVVLRELGDGRTVIEALDPVRQLELTGNPAITPLAAEVRERLARAVERAAGVTDAAAGQPGSP
jgi:uncharacterized protein (DUF302 family)